MRRAGGVCVCVWGWGVLLWVVLANHHGRTRESRTGRGWNLVVNVLSCNAVCGPVWYPSLIRGWCGGRRAVQIRCGKTARIRQKLTWQSLCSRGGEWIIDWWITYYLVDLYWAHTGWLLFMFIVIVVYCFLLVVIWCIHWSLVLIFWLHRGFEDIAWIFLINSQEALHSIKCHCNINVQSDHACYFVHKKKLWFIYTLLGV